MRGILPFLLSPFLPPLVLNAANSGLHPLAQPLPDGSIRFTLRRMADNGEAVAVHCTYAAHRERDVRKTRTFHLIGSPWRIGSNDFMTVQRDEVHVLTQTVTATDAGVTVTIPLHSPDKDHTAYGLERVRIGRVEFERWTPDAPKLDGGFGLVVRPNSLQGAVRLGGIGAGPLRGSLPLWPSLREVDVEVTCVDRPDLELFDFTKKHNWDGFRQTTPQQWPGGRTILVRHLQHSTVWRVHDYYAFHPAKAPSIKAPVPPTDTTAGVGIEVYWPEGKLLEFPEVRFEAAPSVLSIPLARLTPRAREILLSAATLRPGLELHSVSAEEWKELDALGTPPETPRVEWEVKEKSGGGEILIAERRDFTEPLLCLFGADYDEERRVALATVVLYPTAWPGPLPVD